MNGILVVGSVALDSVKTSYGKCKDVLGGSATYFSVSARFFSPVHAIACVGKDFPEKHISFLSKKGVDTKGISAEEGKTFRWEGEYGQDSGDAKTIATHLNVFSAFDPVIPEEYRKCKYVFLANIDPRIQKKVLDQMSDPEVVACDTMNYWIENRRNELVALMKDLDIIFVNESEARSLAGKRDIMQAARQILDLGPKRVIIKRGENGSLLFSRNGAFSTPACPVETALDPTGAGDTFAGGVMGYIAKCGSMEMPVLRRAIAYGGVMASFAVSDFSLRSLGKINKSDMEKRFKEFKELTCF